MLLNSTVDDSSPLISYEPSGEWIGFGHEAVNQTGLKYVCVQLTALNSVFILCNSDITGERSQVHGIQTPPRRSSSTEVVFLYLEENEAAMETLLLLLMARTLPFAVQIRRTPKHQAVCITWR